MKVAEGRDEWPYLMYVQFAPYNNAYVLVYDYDIYYCPGVHSKAMMRVTHDGKTGVIYNGIPDWLYERMFHLISTRLLQVVN